MSKCVCTCLRTWACAYMRCVRDCGTCVLYKRVGRTHTHTPAAQPQGPRACLCHGCGGAGAGAGPATSAPRESPGWGAVGRPRCREGRRETGAGCSLGRSAPVPSTLDPGAHSKVGALVPRDENGHSRAPSWELRKTLRSPSEAWPPARRPWQDAGSEIADCINHCSWLPQIGEQSTKLNLA